MHSIIQGGTSEPPSGPNLPRLSLYWIAIVNPDLAAAKADLGINSATNQSTQHKKKRRCRPRSDFQIFLLVRFLPGQIDPTCFLFWNHIFKANGRYQRH
jgi:hypothetical protein